MDETLRLILIYGVLPIIIGIGSWVMRSMIQRLEEVERKVSIKTDENYVRQLLTDKIDPIREDIHELKAKLDKIVDILLKK